MPASAPSTASAANTRTGRPSAGAQQRHGGERPSVWAAASARPKMLRRGPRAESGARARRNRDIQPTQREAAPSGSSPSVSRAGLARGERGTSLACDWAGDHETGSPSWCRRRGAPRCRERAGQANRRGRWRAPPRARARVQEAARVRRRCRSRAPPTSEPPNPRVSRSTPSRTALPPQEATGSGIGLEPKRAERRGAEGAKGHAPAPGPARAGPRRAARARRPRVSRRAVPVAPHPCPGSASPPAGPPTRARPRPPRRSSRRARARAPRHRPRARPPATPPRRRERRRRAERRAKRVRDRPPPRRRARRGARSEVGGRAQARRPPSSPRPRSTARRTCRVVRLARTGPRTRTHRPRQGHAVELSARSERREASNASAASWRAASARARSRSARFRALHARATTAIGAPAVARSTSAARPAPGAAVGAKPRRSSARTEVGRARRDQPRVAAGHRGARAAGAGRRGPRVAPRQADAGAARRSRRRTAVGSRVSRLGRPAPARSPARESARPGSPDTRWTTRRSRR